MLKAQTDAGNSATLLPEGIDIMRLSYTKKESIPLTKQFGGSVPQMFNPVVVKLDGSKLNGNFPQLSPFVSSKLTAVGQVSHRQNGTHFLFIQGRNEVIYCINSQYFEKDDLQSLPADKR